MLKKEFTPCYTYDQAENDVLDGVLYPSGTNSVDLLHVDASPPPAVTLVSESFIYNYLLNKINFTETEIEIYYLSHNRLLSVR